MANFTARKVYKQIYPATYNFKDEDDGTQDSSIGFITASTPYDGGADIIALYNGHRKVLRFQDDATAGEDPSFRSSEWAAATSGTVEYWIATTDNDNNWWFMSPYESGNDWIDIFRIRNNNIEYWDRADVWQVIQAISNDTWYHIRYTWRADNTFDMYVDGVKQVDNQNTHRAQVSGAGHWYTYGWGDSTEYLYLDAIGISSDSDYNIGDNIHWRQYKESIDDFESDDIGTQGTSITWVDSVDTAASVELVPEFNEHKKVLRQDYTSAAGGYDESQHNFPSQSKDGWFGFWIKVTDITGTNRVFLYDSDGPNAIVNFRINNSQFEVHSGGAWRAVTGAPTPANDTYYFLYIEWYNDDTFDLWIDNVQYEDDAAVQNAMTNGIDQVFIYAYGAGDYVYIDAPMSSLDSDVKAENRTLDYHSLSYTDITSYITLVEGDDHAYGWTPAIIETNPGALTLSALHILQLYDKNSNLKFEGEYTKKVGSMSSDKYPYHSLNKKGLKVQASYTASSEDPSEILLGAFTNVGQEDGRLIYYQEHDPTGSHSPTIINVPNVELGRRMAYHGDTYFIIRPNGICLLDNDRAPIQGAYTITSSTGEIQGTPIIEDYDSQINKVIVEGAFDPDTGTFFSGVSEDTTAQGESDVMEYTVRYPDLRSDTDCQNRAIAIRTGTGFNPQIIHVTFKDVYANPGEIINFAYSPLSFTAANVYVESCHWNLVSGICEYVLTTGIFEDWGMSREEWSLATEGERQMTSGIYATDIVTVDLQLYPSTNAEIAALGIYMDQLDEYATAVLYLPSTCDADRDVVLTLVFRNGNNGALTFDGVISITKYPCDGSSDSTAIDASVNLDAVFTENGGWDVLTRTIDSADVSADYAYQIAWQQKEGAKGITLTTMEATYYIKRSI